MSAGEQTSLRDEQIDAQFAQFKTEIEQMVRPLLGSAPQTKITFNLIRQSVPSANQWVQRSAGFCRTELAVDCGVADRDGPDLPRSHTRKNAATATIEETEPES